MDSRKPCLFGGFFTSIGRIIVEKERQDDASHLSQVARRVNDLDAKLRVCCLRVLVFYGSSPRKYISIEDSIEVNRNPIVLLEGTLPSLENTNLEILLKWNSIAAF